MLVTNDKSRKPDADELQQSNVVVALFRYQKYTAIYEKSNYGLKEMPMYLEEVLNILQITGRKLDAYMTKRESTKVAN